MTQDKVKEWIGLVISALSALYLALKAYGFSPEFLNPEKLNAVANFLMTVVPLGFTIYGIYLNTYVLTKKGKQQDEFLKDKGLK